LKNTVDVFSFVRYESGEFVDGTPVILVHLSILEKSKDLI
jgi:hypothetical protein